MKTLYCLLFTAIPMLLVSCYSEATLEPSERIITSRYEFPQGNNAWDEAASQIYDEFGVYLIYKGFTSDEFGRSWTGAGLAEATLFGESLLNDEQAKFHVNFMKNHVFAYLNRDIIRKVIPTYYLLVYDMHSIFMWGTIEFKTSEENYLEGMDFWAHSIYGEDLNPKTTAADFKGYRFKILQMIMRYSYERGNIDLPDGFADGFDLVTVFPTTYPPEYSTKQKYLYWRGFPNSYAISSAISSTFYNLASVNLGELFVNYMHMAMYYTDEELETLYPSATYPLLHQKKALVVKHMKDNYGIDLQAMVKGPAVLF